eukprot:TRINITY_DN3857_c0_g2_i1.p2 TRINITY_DN3857_c0_g2~~TRINITY_DN3857_c0_g2_i1.p2  ORF type:complete len:288 (-),score=37.86 TRINITY_DN3857_c0_g2_i1:146-1009(-)
MYYMLKPTLLYHSKTCHTLFLCPLPERKRDISSYAKKWQEVSSSSADSQILDLDLFLFGRRGSQKNLVENLQREGIVSTKRVQKVMNTVDRKKYVDEDIPSALAYADQPLPLGDTEETISAPHMHATALEFLQSRLVPGARVLDVGAGSGYLTACLGELVKPNGFVLGIEKHKILTERAHNNILNANPDLIERGIVQLIHGNALSDALDDFDGFDAIHVGAAAEELPMVLVDKLNNDGLMMIPVGRWSIGQRLKFVKKDSKGKVTVVNGQYVRYVPLTEPGVEEFSE